MRLFLSTSLLVAVGFAVRCVVLPDGPEGWDAVDFVLAVEDEYDLRRYQPHFPGYPLYVLLGRLVAATGVEAEAALRGLQALAGAALVVPLCGLAYGRMGCSRGNLLLPALGVGLLPALFLGSMRTEADLLAIVIVLFGFLSAARGRIAFAGLLAGLSLGVRLGALPLVVGLFAWLPFRCGDFSRVGLGRFAAAAGVGGLIWFLPQLALVGGSFFEEAAFFLPGHVGDWGGTVFASGTPRARLEVTMDTFWRGLGGASVWPTLLTGSLVGGGALLYLAARPRRTDLWVAFFTVPQLMVVLFLQNPEHTRHFYPLVLGLGWIALVGWARAPRTVTTFGVVLIFLVGVRSLSLSWDRAREVPPQLAAVAWLLGAPEDAWVFCGQSARLFDSISSDRRPVVRRARDLSGVVRELNGALQLPRRVFVLSEVSGQSPGAEFCRFSGSRSLYDAHEAVVYLYTVRGNPERETVWLEPVVVGRSTDVLPSQSDEVAL